MTKHIHIHVGGKTKDAEPVDLSNVKDLKSAVMQCERKAESLGNSIKDDLLKKACKAAEAKLEEARRILHAAI